MKKFLYKFPAIILATFLTFTFTSCEDFDFSFDESYKRLFSPVTFSSGDVQATDVKITFSKVNGAQKYIFEFAEDSLEFNTIVRTVEIDADTLSLVSGTTNKYEVVFKKLKGETRYSVRIKSVSSDGTPDSKWVTVTFVTKGEQIFSAINSLEKTDHSIVLRWNALGIPVTQIALTNAAGDVLIVVLDANDNAAGMKLIDGLAASTTYTARIYNESNKRGEISFRTYESVPTADKVLYLDGSENLNVLLDTITASNIVLVLPQGSNYAASWTDVDGIALKTLPLNANISSIVFWGADGPVKPVLNLTSMKPGAAINKMVFRNMDIRGYSNTADYLLNENTTRTLSEIKLEDCKINMFRGVLRFQNAANNSVIDKVTINDCVVSNIGNYGVLHASGTQALISDISFSNSTFYNITDAFINLNKKSASIVVSECTLYNCISNGRYIFNFNNVVDNIPGSLKFEKCIIGKFNYATETPDPAFSARSTNPKITEGFALSSYKTSDFIVNTGYPLSGAEDYLKTSFDLFEDPANGNFKIKDTDFAGALTAGDPRWR